MCHLRRGAKAPGRASVEGGQRSLAVRKARLDWRERVRTALLAAMDRLSRIFSNVGGGGAPAAGAPGDTPQVDTSEQVYISSLALLKMLKHGALSRPRPAAGPLPRPPPAAPPPLVEPAALADAGGLGGVVA